MGSNGLIGGTMDLMFGKAKKIGAPEKRNYLSEMQGALTAQGDIQDQLLGLEGQYTPRYQALQQAGISGGMQSLGSLYEQAGGISAGLQSDFLGMQAPLYGQVGQAAMGAYQQSLDPATRGLYSSMMQSAQSDLNAGRELTPQMQQAAQQSARSAMAARGLSGNQAVAQEVLNSYQMQDARENRARQYATQMYGAGLGQTQMALGTYGQPLMNQMASYSPASLVSGGQSLYGGLGAKLFQPESQYNSAIIGSNISNAMQVQMANAQIAAAKQAANMQLVGSVIGGAGAAAGGGATGGLSSMFGCWVARKIYGEQDVRWEIFRNWLITEAPEWLFKLYFKHGEEFSEYISDKPIIKSIIKSMMDLIVIPRFKTYKQYA